MMPQVESNIYLAASSRDALYQSLMDEADKLIKAGRVDGNRIYAMGNSFGGLGTTEFVEKFPDRVAAAIVMCPALTYDDNSTRNLGLIKDVPLWFAQATNDNVIPITVSRSAVSTLEAMGAKEVHLTEFSDEEMLATGALVGYHQADFAVMADDTFLEWLFEKSR
jgi:predicted peptidase